MSGKKTIITLDEGQFGGKYINAAKVEVMESKGTILEKYVDCDQLVEAMTASKTKEAKIFRIGDLPQGFYDGKIGRDSNGRINGKFLVTTDKRKTYITFEETRFVACCPAFLFVFEIKSGRVINTRVFALKGKAWNDSTYLYNCPLGNVSVHTHSICWGSNSLPHIDNLQKLNIVVSMFYDSPCNNDWFSPGMSIKWKCDNLREVLKRLVEPEEFPERLLVSSGIKIGDLL